MAYTPTHSGQLSTDELSKWDRDGYLVLPSIFPQPQLDDLKAELHRIIADFDPTTSPSVIFRTSKDEGSQTVNQQKDSKQSAATAENAYFLNSADNVSVFFEAQAFTEDGKLRYSKANSINKIGHSLRSQSPVYRKFVNQPLIKELAKSLRYKKPIVLQDMAILKPPFIGGVVDVHRDSTFLATDPSSAVGLWITLEDATVTNGCLSFVPGSHRDGLNTKRMIRKGTLKPSINNVTLNPSADKQLHTEERKESSSAALDGPDNNGNVQLEFIGEDPGLTKYAPGEFVEEPVPAGSLVIIHGDVVHASKPNLSEVSRWIFTAHLISTLR